MALEEVASSNGNLLPKLDARADAPADLTDACLPATRSSVAFLSVMRLLLHPTRRSYLFTHISYVLRM